MTAPATTPMTTPGPASPTQARPGSRAARLAEPRSVDVVKQLATEYGVCARPVVLRRTDLDTGQTVVIDLPCGATLEEKCPACATRARRLRRQQIREGWHRDDEPVPDPGPPTDDQVGLLVMRAHLEFDRAQCAAAADWPGVHACDDAIREVEEEIAATGLRGRPAPTHTTDDEPEHKPRKRSTRRRQDVPDLPRKKIQPHTTGRIYKAPDGKTYRPSLFLTLTLPSYGRVWDDGTPVHPDTYDYRQAAWDAVHFPRLLDRFWQNLRRAAGYNLQYAGAVEPQRRLAPHAHFAIRGTIPRDLVRRVAAATYHQVWWPQATERRYQPDAPPHWNADAGGWVDPDTATLLTTWDAALDAIDQNPDAAPAHVVRFGAQVHAEGVLAGSTDAERCVRYITKYLTKHAADCHTTTTVRQQAHLDRLWDQLRVTPCSDRCANWLLYGIQPRHAHAKLAPGRCKARVHQRATLGLGGRRVLVSRQWSGKTLADHRADNRAWVRQLLGLTVDLDQAATDSSGPASRYAWELAPPTDPDVPPLAHRLLRAVSERIQWRNQLDQARRQAHEATGEVVQGGR